LNQLCGADVQVENSLFTTLDPRTRQLDLPGGETVLLTDTVGFIRKLPHLLIEAFASTLEVVAEADLIIHVVDGAARDPAGQVSAVRGVLAEIGAGGVDELMVINKADLVGSGDDDSTREALSLMAELPGAILLSARTGEGLDKLVVAIGDRLRATHRTVELIIPWARGDVLAAVHREGEVVAQVDGEQSTTLHVVLDDVGRERFAEFACR
jgi:GTP-binding protein HflX